MRTGRLLATVLVLVPLLAAPSCKDKTGTTGSENPRKDEPRKIAKASQSGKKDTPRKRKPKPKPLSVVQIRTAHKLRLPLTTEIALGRGVSMKFVLIPAQTFMMGSAISAEETAKRFGGRAAWFKDEHPSRLVEITKPFYLGIHEVTNAQYGAFRQGHSNRYAGKPVIYVSWAEAQEFCLWLSHIAGRPCRLPTEAEWEYACRAGSTSVFPWGDKITGEHCNFADKSTSAPWRHKTVDDGHRIRAAVGSYTPNAFGLYDMIGNVSEWCADWYGKNYYRSSCCVDPKGPPRGAHRVVRGNSWSNPPGRSANRSSCFPHNGENDIGFRVVLSAPLVLWRAEVPD